MTEEEKYDRWERFAKLLYKRCLDESLVSRKQTALLKCYVEALRGYDAAKQTVEEKLGDSEQVISFDRAREVLDQAREELKKSTRKQPGRLRA